MKSLRIWIAVLSIVALAFFVFACPFIRVSYYFYTNYFVSILSIVVSGIIAALALVSKDYNPLALPIMISSLALNLIIVAWYAEIVYSSFVSSYQWLIYALYTEVLFALSIIYLIKSKFKKTDNINKFVELTKANSNNYSQTSFETILSAKKLLDVGAITEEEFEEIKRDILKTK